MIMIVIRDDIGINAHILINYILHIMPFFSAIIRAFSLILMPAYHPKTTGQSDMPSSQSHPEQNIVRLFHLLLLKSHHQQRKRQKGFQPSLLLPASKGYFQGRRVKQRDGLFLYSLAISSELRFLSSTTFLSKP